MDKLPYFSRGSYAALKKALNDGVYENLDRVVYYFVTDGKYAGDFCLVYTDKTIHHVSSSSLATQVAALGSNVNDLTGDVDLLTEEINNIKESPTVINWEEF